MGGVGSPVQKWAGFFIGSFCLNHLRLMTISTPVPTIERGIPAPKKPVRVRRLTEEMRRMEVGDSVVLSFEEARCLKSYFTYNGFGSSCQKIGHNSFRVWRLT